MAETDKPTTPADAEKAEAAAAKAIRRRDPEDPKSDPVLDFATYDDAAAQAKALGKSAYVEPIGTAYRVVTGE